ncbi:hypothetical protein ACFONG_02500 [Uliginosibacterium paludis]|uniref:Uncharacterized protein n=1 Tax=Uliginosibacterium paludis TaxID=1615952 RepID=A0ABV2CPB9_9RHOO
MKHPPMFLMLLLATALSAPDASGSPLESEAPGADKRSTPRQDGADAAAAVRPDPLRTAA